MKFIKASERLPNGDTYVLVRNITTKHRALVNAIDLPSLDGLNNVEWLDESESPSTPLSVEEAAGDKNSMYEICQEWFQMNTLLAEITGIGKMHTVARFKEEWEKMKSKFHTPIPSDIVQALANSVPYKSGDNPAGAYYHGWGDCISKLRELLSSQPSQEQKQNAADIWQLIPENIKQSYSGPEEFLADMQAMHHFKNIKDEVYKKLTGQGSVQGLVKALDQIKNLVTVKSPHSGSVTSKRVLDIIKDGLQSFYLLNQTEKEEEKS